MKQEDKIADALAERLVNSFGGKAVEVIEILLSLEKIIQKKERLAFADWLEQLDSDIGTCDLLEVRSAMVRNAIKNKIEEIRSEWK